MNNSVTPLGQSGVVVRQTTWQRLMHNPLGVTALIVLSLIILAAILAPFITSYDPNFSDINNTLGAMSAEHLLGTDSGGRDVWSRLVYGARLTLISALLCAVVSATIGLTSGLLAGYYGGWFDNVASWSANMLLSLPGIMVLLAVRAAIGPSVLAAMFIFGILLSPGYFRLTRTVVQSVRNELYVDAARVSGLTDARIISRHILSVTRAPLIIQTAVVAGLSIAIQSGLDFLGLGDPTQASWGAMLSDGFRNVYLNPLLLVWPTLAISITIASIVLLGNAIRDALEDRQTPKPPRAQRASLAREATAAQALATEQAAALQPSTHLLQVSGLGVGYPQSDGSIKKVVDDVSFFVDRGEVLSIVGESGSGKSQTAFSILGLLPDTARITGGSIQFDGEATVRPGDTTVPEDRIRQLRGRRISYIPQEPMSNLDPAFTVGSQLVRPMQVVLGISKAEASKRAIDLLDKVGIRNPERAYKLYPHELSGGMAQRVLIAGAISCEPDLIIADEPTTALDVTVQAEVLDLLRDMQQELGVGVILVTHNFGVVADIADRVVVMQSGHVVEEGKVDVILNKPTHPYTKTLLASMLEDKKPLSMLTTPNESSDK